jgi:hypothetical protein
VTPVGAVTTCDAAGAAAAAAEVLLLLVVVVSGNMLVVARALAAAVGLARGLIVVAALPSAEAATCRPVHGEATSHRVAFARSVSEQCWRAGVVQRAGATACRKQHANREDVIKARCQCLSNSGVAMQH